jgi:hypothetical protein
MNSNLLSLTGFKLEINNIDFKHTQYFALSASFPAVSLPEITTAYRNSTGFVAGDKLAYDALTVRVAIDENLESYNEIYDWLRYNVENAKLKTHDITLCFLTNHNNVGRKVRFTNAFPTNLGGIEFSVQQTDVEYAAIDITFRYDWFEFTD